MLALSSPHKDMNARQVFDESNVTAKANKVNFLKDPTAKLNPLPFLNDGNKACFTRAGFI